jgi:hypothetical protein
MQSAVAKYHQLEAEKIIETVKALHARIEERFPGSGLGKVVGELQQVAEETVGRTCWIQRPHLLLRCVAVLLSLGIIIVLAFLVAHVRQFNFDDFTNSVQALDASISSVVFVGAAIQFFLSWEHRIKRDRALKAIHKLRALALTSKIAAFYVQGFQDPVLLDAVDDVEDLTAGFSRKIWQKITILENLRHALHGGQVAE